MIFDVRLGSFSGMVRSVIVMAMGEVGMVRSRFVPAALMMFRGFAMMSCCAVVMFCRLVMMLRCFL